MPHAALTPTEQPSSPTARAAALDWLLGRINYERVAVVPYNERQLKLDRMRGLLTRLGRPDAGMKIVHVAGTKGKGSTAAMIAGALRAAGFRAGLFTSPHLERMEERFVVDGEPCTAEELTALVDRVRPVVADMDAGDDGPTFFEIVTALALLHFVERRVDAAVLEVGLGGRLDSTNVCLPAVSVITSISFDHTKQLGHTLSAIAHEKAGIIKPGVPVVCGVTDGEPQHVIADVAREHGCRLIQLDRDFSFRYWGPPRSGFKTLTDHPVERRGEGETASARRPSPCPLPRGEGFESRFRAFDESRAEDGTYGRRTADCSLASAENRLLDFGHMDFNFSVPGNELELAGLRLAMLGMHQAANAAVALATLCELRSQGWHISTGAMHDGIARTSVPGRVEVVPGEPLVVLDVSHNAASARALVAALRELAPPSRRTLIVSVSEDKDVSAIVAELAPHFDRFIATRFQENPRSIGAERLADVIRGQLATDASDPRGPVLAPRSAIAPQAESSYSSPEVAVCPTPKEAWTLAANSALPGELVCIAGSLFLVAELRAFVRGQRSREPPAA